MTLSNGPMESYKVADFKDISLFSAFFTEFSAGQLSLVRGSIVRDGVKAEAP